MKKYMFLLLFFTYLCIGKCLKHSLKIHLEQDLKYLTSDSTQGLKQKSRYDLNQDLIQDLDQGFEKYLKYLKSDSISPSKHSSKDDLGQILKQGSKQDLKDDSEHNLNQGTKQGFKQALKRGSKHSSKHDSRECLKKGSKQGFDQYLKQVKGDLMPRSNHSSKNDLRPSLKLGSIHNLTQGFKDDSENKLNQGFKHDLKHLNSDLIQGKSSSKHDSRQSLKNGSKQGFDQYLKHVKGDLMPRSNHSSKNDLRPNLELGFKHNLTQGSKQGFKDDSENKLNHGFKCDLKHLNRDLIRGKSSSKHDLRQSLKNEGLTQGSKRGLKHGFKRSKQGMKHKLISDLDEVDSLKRLLKLPLPRSEELPPPPFGLEGGSLGLGGGNRPRERFLSFLNPFSTITSALNGFKDKDLKKFSMRVGVLPKHLSDYPYYMNTIDPLAGGVFEELRPSFVAGIPEIGCPVLDPLDIDVLEGDIKDFMLKAHIIFENMHVYGLSIIEITALEVDYDTYGFYFAFTLPEVIVKLDYIFDASIVRFIPFRLDGNVTWVSTDIKGKGVGALNIAGRDLSLSLDGFEVSLDIRHNNLKFSKLLGLSFLDTGLSWVISKFVNAWLILFKNTFSNVVSAYILVVANDVLSNIRLWGRQ